MQFLQLAAPPSETPLIDIGLVERETGVPKDTLRIWERRYGFPAPIRSIAGRRAYSEKDIIKLRLLKRLIDQGFRPNAIIAKPVDALQTLIERLSPKIGAPISGRSQFVLPADLLKDSKVAELSRWISSASAMLDARSFILDCVRPLCQQLGEAWAQTRLSIGCEHIISEQVQSLLRQTIAAASYSTPQPTVLLTTPPGEKHGLGLLMVRALLSCDGVASLSLGTETPIDEIAKCVDLLGVTAVGISISSSFGKKPATRFLRALRTALPAEIDLWAGGAGVYDISASIGGVRFLSELEDVRLISGRQPING